MKVVLRAASAVAGVILIGGLLGALPENASAAAPAPVTVTTPTHVASYNGKPARIHAGASAKGRRVIRRRVLTVYRAGHRYKSGSGNLSIPVGTYTTVTSVGYQNYAYKTVKRVRRVRHEGGYFDAHCVVIKFVEDAGGYGESTARCSYARFPTQHPLDTEFGTSSEYHVGARYEGQLIHFKTEYVNVPYAARVRVYSRHLHFRSKPHHLTVVDGGYRRAFVGSGIEDTSRFHPPSGSWRINYSFDCSSFGYSGNFIITVYRSNGDYEKLSANRLARRGSGTSHVYASGSFYLEINSECDWQVAVRD